MQRDIVRPNCVYEEEDTCGKAVRPNYASSLVHAMCVT
jgi:hypothetical protein